jgi:hypothetical protein
MHLSHYLLNFWKHCSKDVCGIAFKSFIAFEFLLNVLVALKECIAIFLAVVYR